MPSSILNSDDGVISGTSGLKSTGGDDGVLVFQSKGTETARINTDSQIVAAAGTASLPVLTTTGDVNTGIYFPAADNIGFATGGTIRGRWTTDGLCFGSDTAAANALDDYEEGTFTPTYFGSTAAGTTTYTIQNGFYTKIGKLVTFQLNLGWSNATGTGNARIGGLPFTSSGTTNEYPAVSCRNDGHAQAGEQLQGFIDINSTVLELGTANLTSGSNTNIAVDSSVQRMMWSGFYYTS
jgi:hypothetical protein